MNLKQTVQERFSQKASSYDRHAAVQKEMANGVIKFLDDLEATLPLRLLEIGCGTGYLTGLLLERFPGASLTANDIAPGMIEAVRRKFARERCNFVLEDAEEWVATQPEASFEAIVSSACFQWFTQPLRTLRELHRLLTPKGKLVFSTFGPQTFCELHDSFAQAHERLHIPYVRHGLTFLGEEEWRFALRNAGFERVEIHRALFREYHPGVREFLHAVKQIGANTSPDKGSGGLGSRRLMTAMMDAYEQNYRTDLGIQVTYEIIWGTGVK